MIAWWPTRGSAAPRPERLRRGQHADPLGRSYAADDYELLVEQALTEVEMGADFLAAVLTDDAPAIEPDRLVLNPGSTESLADPVG